MPDVLIHAKGADVGVPGLIASSGLNEWAIADQMVFQVVASAWAIPATEACWSRICAMAHRHARLVGNSSGTSTSIPGHQPARRAGLQRVTSGHVASQAVQLKRRTADPGRCRGVRLPPPGRTAGS